MNTESSNNIIHMLPTPTTASHSKEKLAQENSMLKVSSPSRTTTSMSMSMSMAMATPMAIRSQPTPTSSQGTDIDSESIVDNTIISNDNINNSINGRTKINIDQVNDDVVNLLNKIDILENENGMEVAIENGSFSGNGNVSRTTNKNTDISVNELKEILISIKQTILRLNLKNNLIRRELSSLKEEYQIERRILLKSVENTERTSRLIKDENNEINNKNLKLIKYIKLLKNEKIHNLHNENIKLHEKISYLQKNNSSSKNKKRKKVDINDEIYNEANNNDENESLKSPTSNMLDTLGKLASRVLEDEEFITNNIEKSTIL